MDISKWGLGEGGYVFLSHSHQDIVKVRKIRNYLEEQGFEPLCFFLKCLEQDGEIFGLIEREIEAREWFVCLQSANTNRSKWVSRELECAERLGKAIIVIDLDKENSVEAISTSIASSMRVFLSYARKDYQVAKAIADYLVAKDLKVFFDMESIQVGESFVEKIEDNIVEAANHGCVLALITEHSINNEYVIDELYLAAQNKASILPIVIGDFELPTKLSFIINFYQWLKFEDEKDVDLEKIYAAARSILLAKLEEAS